MVNENRVLGLILARGGSKRLPRKNIIELCGKPLIVWTIEAANCSTAIDDLYVSTDDSEIANVSGNSRVTGIIQRPPELATDYATSQDGVLHAIEYLCKLGKRYKYVCLLQASSPLRQGFHIDEAYELMVVKKAQAIIGVCETACSLTWMGYLPPNHSMDGILAQKSQTNDEQSGYQINGAIYFFEVVDPISQTKIFPVRGSYAYVMDRKYSIDIDTMEELSVAKALIESGR